MSSSSETVFNERYRAIYAVDERPGSRVFRCRDDQSGKLVLVAELPAPTGEATADLELLAKQIATVTLDGLQPLTDHFAAGNNYFLVCDDPGGQDLDRALRTRGGPLPEADALVQMRRLLELTGQLHSQKPALYLGDPMPGDLWVAERGVWTLVPFTLARPIGQSPSPYRAPELTQPDGEPNQASDIYGLGALLYQVMTGWAPPTAEQQQAGMPLNGPRVLNPQVSQLAEQALLRSLQPKPMNRYQTAREMRIALETISMLGGRSLGLGPDVLSGAEMLPSNMAQPLTPAVTPQLVLPPPAAASPGAPPPVVTPPPAYAPAQPYPPQAAQYPPQQKRGISTGCLIGIAVALALLALSICGALAFFVLSTTSFSSVLPNSGPTVAAQTAAPATAVPTSAPTAAASAPTTAPAMPAANVAADAITLDSVSAITETSEITGSVFGPVAYAPGGEAIAVGLSDAVSLLNAETLENSDQLNGHTGKVTSLAWSGDGALLASGASQGDERIIVWDVASGTQKHILEGHSGWIRSLAFAPNGNTLASGSVDQTIKLWDAESGALLHTLGGHTSMIGGLAFSPDGARLVSGSRDGSVRLWDVAAGSEITSFSFRAPADPQTTARYWTTGVAFSPDGTRVVAGATNGIVYVLDATTGDEQRQLVGHTNWIVIRGVAFAPDGRLYTSGLDSTVRVWDVASGQQTEQFDGHSLDVFAIGLNTDGTRLVSVSDQEGRMIIWDTASGEGVDSLRVGQGVVTSLQYSPDSAVLGSVGYNGIVQLRLMADGRFQLLPGSVLSTQSLAFLSTGRMATITDQQTVALLDLTAQNSTELSGLSAAPLNVAASDDGAVLAAGTISGTVTLWDGATSDERGELRGNLPTVALLAVSHDGSLLAAAGPASDPSVEIWDVARRALLHTLPAGEAPVSALAFQPGGTLLALATLDGSMTLFDGQAGTSVRTIPAAPEHGWFAGVAFSPDGELVATGTPTGLIQFWNAATGAEVASLTQEYGVVAMDFSPDGRQLAVSGRDTRVLVYELQS
jgi:WD40 repeat protein